jgi:uncharacterized protein
LLEQHWSYMDGFAESMIARGPTLTSDRETATGSLHVLGLPSVDAVHEFVDREPNNRAGVYAEHLVYRFENLLGRTMWDFRRTTDEPLFLVIAPATLERLPSEQLILHGALGTLDDGSPAGFALATQARDGDAVRALVPDAEIHDWEFGGRR